jgi:hypothetical protein
MSSYRVLVQGTGGLRKERRGIFRRVAILPFGLFTTRFVVAPNETVAAEKAIDLVRPDAAPWTLAEAPWTLTATEVEQVDDADVRDVQGFSFYRGERH